MPKVQQRKVGKYKQLYIALPAKLCEAMQIDKSVVINISIASKDSLMLKIQR